MFCRNLCAALGVAAILVAGCATEEEKVKELEKKAVASNAETKAAVQKAKATLESTVASLQLLMDAPPDEVKPAAERFTKRMDEMKKVIEDIRARADDMKARNAEYHDRWQKERAEMVTAPMSDERRAQVKVAHDKVVVAWGGARDAFKPFWANLEDLKKTLVELGELTKAKVASLDPTVKAVRAEGQNAKQKVDAAIAEMEAYAKAIAGG